MFKRSTHIMYSLLVLSILFDRLQHLVYAVITW